MQLERPSFYGTSILNSNVLFCSTQHNGVRGQEAVGHLFYPAILYHGLQIAFKALASTRTTAETSSSLLSKNAMWRIQKLQRVFTAPFTFQVQNFHVKRYYYSTLIVERSIRTHQVDTFTKELRLTVISLILFLNLQTSAYAIQVDNRNTMIGVSVEVYHPALIDSTKALGQTSMTVIGMSTDNAHVTTFN